MVAANAHLITRAVVHGNVAVLGAGHDLPVDIAKLQGGCEGGLNGAAAVASQHIDLVGQDDRGGSGGLVSAYPEAAFMLAVIQPQVVAGVGLRVEVNILYAVHHAPLQIVEIYAAAAQLVQLDVLRQGQHVNALLLSIHPEDFVAPSVHLDLGLLTQSQGDGILHCDGDGGGLAVGGSHGQLGGAGRHAVHVDLAAPDTLHRQHVGVGGDGVEERAGTVGLKVHPNGGGGFGNDRASIQVQQNFFRLGSHAHRHIHGDRLAAAVSEHNDIGFAARQAQAAEVAVFIENPLAVLRADPDVHIAGQGQVIEAVLLRGHGSRVDLIVPGKGYLMSHVQLHGAHLSQGNGAGNFRRLVIVQTDQIPLAGLGIEHEVAVELGAFYVLAAVIAEAVHVEVKVAGVRDLIESVALGGEPVIDTATAARHGHIDALAQGGLHRLVCAHVRHGVGVLRVVVGIEVIGHAGTELAEITGVSVGAVSVPIPQSGVVAHAAVVGAPGPDLHIGILLRSDREIPLLARFQRHRDHLVGRQLDHGHHAGVVVHVVIVESNGVLIDVAGLQPHHSVALVDPLAGSMVIEEDTPSAAVVTVYGNHHIGCRLNHIADTLVLHRRSGDLLTGNQLRGHFQRQGDRSGLVAAVIHSGGINSGGQIVPAALLVIIHAGFRVLQGAVQIAGVMVAVVQQVHAGLVDYHDHRFLRPGLDLHAEGAAGAQDFGHGQGVIHGVVIAGGIRHFTLVFHGAGLRSGNGQGAGGLVLQLDPFAALVQVKPAVGNAAREGITLHPHRGAAALVSGHVGAAMSQEDHAVHGIPCGVAGEPLTFNAVPAGVVGGVPVVAVGTAGHPFVHLGAVALKNNAGRTGFPHKLLAHTGDGGRNNQNFDAVFRKGAGADVGHSVGDGDLGQTGVAEGRLADVGQLRRQGDLGQLSAVQEGIQLQGGDTLGNGHADQISTVVEGTLTHGGHTLGNLKGGGAPGHSTQNGTVCAVQNAVHALEGGAAVCHINAFQIFTPDDGVAVHLGQAGGQGQALQAGVGKGLVAQRGQTLRQGDALQPLAGLKGIVADGGQSGGQGHGGGIVAVIKCAVADVSHTLLHHDGLHDFAHFVPRCAFQLIVRHSAGAVNSQHAGHTGQLPTDITGGAGVNLLFLALGADAVHKVVVGGQHFGPFITAVAPIIDEAVLGAGGILAVNLGQLADAGVLDSHIKCGISLPAIQTGAQQIGLAGIHPHTNAEVGAVVPVVTFHGIAVADTHDAAHGIPVTVGAEQIIAGDLGGKGVVDPAVLHSGRGDLLTQSQGGRQGHGDGAGNGHALAGSIGNGGGQNQAAAGLHSHAGDPFPTVQVNVGECVEPLMLHGPVHVLGDLGIDGVIGHVHLYALAHFAHVFLGAAADGHSGLAERHCLVHAQLSRSGLICRFMAQAEAVGHAGGQVCLYQPVIAAHTVRSVDRGAIAALHTEAVVAHTLHQQGVGAALLGGKAVSDDLTAVQSFGHIAPIQLHLRLGVHHRDIGHGAGTGAHLQGDLAGTLALAVEPDAVAIIGRKGHHALIAAGPHSVGRQNQTGLHHHAQLVAEAGVAFPRNGLDAEVVVLGQFTHGGHAHLKGGVLAGVVVDLKHRNLTGGQIHGQTPPVTGLVSGAIHLHRPAVQSPDVIVIEQILSVLGRGERKGLGGPCCLLLHVDSLILVQGVVGGCHRHSGGGGGAAGIAGHGDGGGTRAHAAESNGQVSAHNGIIIIFIENDNALVAAFPHVVVVNGQSGRVIQRQGAHTADLHLILLVQLQTLGELTLRQIHADGAPATAVGEQNGIGLAGGGSNVGGVYFPVVHREPLPARGADVVSVAVGHAGIRTHLRVRIVPVGVGVEYVHSVRRRGEAEAAGQPVAGIWEEGIRTAHFNGGRGIFHDPAVLHLGSIIVAADDAVHGDHAAYNGAVIHVAVEG